MDRLNESTKPAHCCRGFFSDIADEANVILLGIDQCRFDAAFLGRCDAEPNRLYSFEPIKQVKNLLVALRILNHNFGFSVHGENDGLPRLLHPAHEAAGVSLKVGERVDVLRKGLSVHPLWRRLWSSPL